MTKKELLEKLEGVDDNTRIIVKSSNFELGNSFVEAKAYVGKYSKEVKRFVDAFDGESYSTVVFVDDEDGEATIVIRG